MSRHLTHFWNSFGIFAIAAVILLAGTGCEQKHSVRASGGEAKGKVSAEKLAETAQKEQQNFIETEVIEGSNALAMKAAIEYMESTRALAVLVKFLKTDADKRTEFAPEITLKDETAEGGPHFLEIKQSQSSSLYDITSVQGINIQAKKIDNKYDFSDLRMSWFESTQVAQKSKDEILEIRHQFNWQLSQESDKVLVAKSRDATIFVEMKREKVKIDIIADISLKMNVEDLGHIEITELEIKNSRLSSQDRARSRSPLLEMSSTQKLQLQLRANPEKPKGMSSICYDLTAGSFKSGDYTSSLDARIESNRLTLRNRVIALSSCPTSTFTDAIKWLVTDKSKKTTPNLRVERSILDED